MWLFGKIIWKSGTFPPLAEPWRPGLIGSWLMLPAFLIISYGILMFKEQNFCPFRSLYDPDRVKEDVELQQGNFALLEETNHARHVTGATIQNTSVTSQSLKSLRASAGADTV